MKEFLEKQGQFVAVIMSLITVVGAIFGVWYKLETKMVEITSKQTSDIIVLIDDILRDDLVNTKLEIEERKRNGTPVPDRFIIHQETLEEQRDKIEKWTSKHSH